MHPGLCQTCIHTRRIESAKGSVFWLCQHPQLPKYPRLPVVSCGGYQGRGSTERSEPSGA